MSRSNRYGNLTLALIAGAVLVFMMLLFAAVVSEHRAQLHRVYEDYQQNAGKERRKAADEAAGTCVGMETGAFIKCVSDQIAAYYNQQTTNQDLKAQQDMALWAFWMFIASCGTVFIAGIGIYYIRNTLIETQRAAEASTIAAEAAQAAVAVTQEASERQLRAYVGIDEVEIGGHDTAQVRTAMIRVVVKNFGQTPARNVSMDTLVELVGPDVDADRWPLENLAMLGSINPGHQMTAKIRTGCPIYNELSSGFFTLRVSGGIHYDTVLGHRQLTEFAYQIAEIGAPTESMTMADQGNQAT